MTRSPITEIDFRLSIKVPSLPARPFFFPIPCDQYLTSDLKAVSLIFVNSGITRALRTSRRGFIVIIDQLFDIGVGNDTFKGKERLDE